MTPLPNLALGISPEKVRQIAARYCLPPKADVPHPREPKGRLPVTHSSRVLTYLDGRTADVHQIAEFLGRTKSVTHSVLARLKKAGLVRVKAEGRAGKLGRLAIWEKVTR